MVAVVRFFQSASWCLAHRTTAGTGASTIESDVCSLRQEGICGIMVAKSSRMYFHGCASSQHSLRRDGDQAGHRQVAKPHDRKCQRRNAHALFRHPPVSFTQDQNGEVGNWRHRRYQPPPSNEAPRTLRPLRLKGNSRKCSRFFTHWVGRLHSGRGSVLLMCVMVLGESHRLLASVGAAVGQRVRPQMAREFERKGTRNPLTAGAAWDIRQPTSANPLSRPLTFDLRPWVFMRGAPVKLGRCNSTATFRFTMKGDILIFAEIIW